MLASTLASRAVARMQPQRRSFIDYLAKYPDKVMETKKLQMTGGTKLGEANPTWMKQPGDYYTLAVAGAITFYGMAQITVGIYRLATGKGKMD